MIQALYSNAANLPETMAGIKNGYVGLTTEDTLYATLETGIPWEYLDKLGAMTQLLTTNSPMIHTEKHATFSKNMQPLTRPSSTK